jgi:hypothetical protein
LDTTAEPGFAGPEIPGYPSIVETYDSGETADHHCCP